jgi:hypothetical protein
MTSRLPACRGGLAWRNRRPACRKPRQISTNRPDGDRCPRSSLCPAQGRWPVSPRTRRSAGQRAKDQRRQAASSCSYADWNQVRRRPHGHGPSKHLKGQLPQASPEMNQQKRLGRQAASSGRMVQRTPRSHPLLGPGRPPAPRGRKRRPVRFGNTRSARARRLRAANDFKRIASEFPLPVSWLAFVTLHAPISDDMKPSSGRVPALPMNGMWSGEAGGSAPCFPDHEGRPARRHKPWTVVDDLTPTCK